MAGPEPQNPPVGCGGLGLSLLPLIHSGERQAGRNEPGSFREGPLEKRPGGGQIVRPDLLLRPVEQRDGPSGCLFIFFSGRGRGGSFFG